MMSAAVNNIVRAARSPPESIDCIKSILPVVAGIEKQGNYIFSPQCCT
jgi:hypothetical protein